jgi:hypothetical protein
LATRYFEVIEPAVSDDAYGGVAAANHATAKLVTELAAWLETIAKDMKRSSNQLPARLTAAQLRRSQFHLVTKLSMRFQAQHRFVFTNMIQTGLKPSLLWPIPVYLR